jgi:hypothetical protein
MAFFGLAKPHSWFSYLSRLRFAGYYVVDFAFVLDG